MSEILSISALSALPFKLSNHGWGDEAKKLTLILVYPHSGLIGYAELDSKPSLLLFICKSRTLVLYRIYGENLSSQTI